MPRDLILRESSEPEQADSVKKRRRGRPKVISDFIEECFYKPYVYSNSIKTRRGHLNEHYRFQALSALIVDDDEFIDPKSSDFEFKWLYDDDTLSQKRPRAYRKTILAELGRLQEPSLIRDVARQMCALKPRAKDAAVMIRQRRLRQLSAHKPSEQNDVQLAKELIDAVLNYLKRYPGTPFSDIYSALKYVHTLMRTADELPG
jgi:hypothetical protein